MGNPPAHRPRKRFGQNFLHDPGVIHNIISAIHPQEQEKLVEIGPGKGALTRHLLKACSSLDVVELDRDLIPILQEECSPLGELRIHNVDALKFDFSSLTSGNEKLRVVGNLPYNISTPLIFHLLEQAAEIKDMHFMLQKEVVERLAASPGGKDYGRLSIMVQYYCEVEKLFTVPPGAFFPPPKVTSAVVRLTPYEKPKVTVKDIAVLNRVVTQAFSQRRKTLRNTLKKLIDTETISGLDIDPSRRPETLSLEEYARLADALAGGD